MWSQSYRVNIFRVTVVGSTAPIPPTVKKVILFITQFYFHNTSVEFEQSNRDKILLFELSRLERVTVVLVGADAGAVGHHVGNVVLLVHPVEEVRKWTCKKDILKTALSH